MAETAELGQIGRYSLLIIPEFGKHDLAELIQKLEPDAKKAFVIIAGSDTGESGLYTGRYEHDSGGMPRIAFLGRNMKIRRSVAIAAGISVLAS